MKWILTLLVFISSYSFGQIGLRDDSTKYIRYQNQYGSRLPRFWADSAFHLPYFDTTLVKPQKAGALMMHLDKNVYKWNGAGWESTGSGGSSGPPSLTYKYIGYGGIGGVLSSGEAAFQYDSITNKLTVDNINLNGLTATRPLKLNGSKDVISTQIDLASSNDVTGILPINNTDTNTTNGLATRYALTQKSNITSLEGVLYDENSWSSISGFTQRGTTPTISSNAIAFTGGTNDFAKTIDLDTTMRERWVMHIEQQVGTVSSTSDGLAIGVRSVNPNSANGVCGILITNNTGNGGKLLLIDTYNSSVIATSASAVSFSAGDTVVFELERDRLGLTLKGWNKTTGSATVSVSYTYTLDESPAHVLPNSGTFSVFNVGGSQNMTALTINSKEAKNAPLLLAGDSKLSYYAADSQLGTLLDRVFRPTNIHGGPADRLIELLATEDDVIALTPANLAISIGSNDIGSGYSVSQTFTRYKQYVARAEAAGINVFHLLPFYQTTIVAELDSLADSIRIEYPTKIIDCRTPMRRCPSCFLASDNVHLNAAGNLLTYDVILNSGKLASYYKTPIGSAGSSALDLNDVLTNGGSSGLPMSLTGSSTTDSKLKVGSLELQPYAINNAWIGENTYFDGSNWKYRATGYAERFHFQNGHLFFETAASGSAGANVTWNLPMLADPSNNIGIGVGMDPNSPLYSDAALNITASDGRVVIPGSSATNSKFQVGSFEVSPHGANNVTIADNAYFDGANWKRRASGYASMLHFQNGFAYISTTGTSTAGSNITWTLPMLADADGNLGLGGMNQSSPSYTGASVYIPAATGKLHVINMDSTASPANMVWRDPTTKELKLAAVPGGGISDINSQTGSSQIISGGPGVSVNSSSDVHTVGLNTTLDAQVADANNTGTSATDLYSKTIAANQFTLNGQSVHFEAAGVFNDATATVNLEALFAGNGIAGTGAVTITGTGAWSMQGTIIRATSTTARVYTVVTIDNCTQKVFSTTANLTGIDWTTTNILKIQATAGGGGGGSNDITAQMWKVVFQP